MRALPQERAHPEHKRGLAPRSLTWSDTGCWPQPSCRAHWGTSRPGLTGGHLPGTPAHSAFDRRSGRDRATWTPAAHESQPVGGVTQKWTFHNIQTFALISTAARNSAIWALCLCAGWANTLSPVRATAWPAANSNLHWNLIYKNENTSPAIPGGVCPPCAVSQWSVRVSHWHGCTPPDSGRAATSLNTCWLPPAVWWHYLPWDHLKTLLCRHWWWLACPTLPGGIFSSPGSLFRQRWASSGPCTAAGACQFFF